MLYEEAKWVGENIRSNIGDIKRILNLGSSSLHFRTKIQPQIEEFIFSGLKEQGIEVIHSDIRKEEGVDIVGDFTDPVFVSQLAEMHFDMVVCCNLLEHLEERKHLINTLNSIIPSGGKLLITVPYKYPYHKDPIDTLYRPTVKELIADFSNYELINGTELRARRFVAEGNGKYQKNYFQLLCSKPISGIKIIARVCLPFYQPKVWKILAKDLKFMFQEFEVTCVVLQKK